MDVEAFVKRVVELLPAEIEDVARGYMENGEYLVYVEGQKKPVVCISADGVEALFIRRITPEGVHRFELVNAIEEGLREAGFNLQIEGYGFGQNPNANRVRNPWFDTSQYAQRYAAAGHRGVSVYRSINSQLIANAERQSRNALAKAAEAELWAGLEADQVRELAGYEAEQQQLRDEKKRRDAGEEV